MAKRRVHRRKHTTHRRVRRRRMGAIHEGSGELIGVALGVVTGGILQKMIPDTSASGKDMRLIKGLGAAAIGWGVSILDGGFVRGIGYGVLGSGIYKIGQKFNLIADQVSAVGALPEPIQAPQLQSAVGAASRAEELQAIGMFE